MSDVDLTAAVDPAPSPAETRRSGPLLAVCGLCGGAGASTLAALVAQHVSGDAELPVLVCDTGGPTGGLAAYLGAQSANSLPGLANAIAGHEPLAGGLFADGGNGLRFIARGPQLDGDGDAQGLARVLADARRAHRLTVVDCGTLARRADRQAFACATHVAWIVPVTAGAVARGRRLLELVPSVPERRELLIARRDGEAPKAPLTQLRALAGARGAPLVLLPHVDEPHDPGTRPHADAASLALDAIASELTR